MPKLHLVDHRAMAMWETILATVSGLGGAGLGAGGALLVQRAKRRDDAAAAAATARRAEEELTLEIIAAARAAARAWLIAAERAISDLQLGRAVDAERYDGQLQAELREFTSGLYRMAGRRLPDTRLTGTWTRPAGPFDSRPLVDQLSDTSQRIREAIHHGTGSPLPQTELEGTLTEARSTFWAINEFLIRNTQALTEQLFPPPMEQLLPPPMMAPAPDWAAHSAPGQPHE
ncbi:hypothetical protein ACWGCK_37760 [Streptomyces virginiae]|uniref:hypothetical protein n=1 Tax=Streptomyces virginiae TaxID=1961 RepID=UPI002F90D71C